MGGSSHIGYRIFIVMRPRFVAKLSIVLAIADARMNQRTRQNFAGATAIRPVNNNDGHKVRLLR